MYGILLISQLVTWVIIYWDIYYSQCCWDSCYRIKGYMYIQVVICIPSASFESSLMIQNSVPVNNWIRKQCYDCLVNLVAKRCVFGSSPWPCLLLSCQIGIQQVSVIALLLSVLSAFVFTSIKMFDLNIACLLLFGFIDIERI